MQKLKKVVTHPIFISCSAILFAFLLNEWNSSVAPSQNVKEFGLITTADDASYLAPPTNFYAEGVWKDNSVGQSAYFKRPPGYGSLYYFSLLLSPTHPLLVLKYIQLILLGTSVWFFYKILESLIENRIWVIVGAYMFVLHPMFNGFVYYTISEAVTPFIVCWFLYAVIQVNNQKSRSWLHLLIATSVLLLVRPQLIPLPLAIGMFFILQKKWKMMLFLSLGCLPFLAWMLRTNSLDSTQTSLHPIYSVTNNHIYRPMHQALTDVYRVWEYRSDVFHGSVGQLVQNDEVSFDTALAEIPNDYKPHVIPLLKQYRSLEHLRRAYPSDHSFTGYLPGEKQFINSCEQLKEQLVDENRWNYYISVPVKSAFEMLPQSHLNLYLFQGHLRGNVVMETFRYFTVGIVLVIFFLPFGLVFSIHPQKQLLITLFVGVLAILFYYFEIQRLNESRYLLPLLPILLTTSIVVLHQLLTRFKQQ